MAAKTSKQPAYFSLQIAEARRFQLELKPPSDVALAVVSGGCEHCAKNYEVHRSTFSYWGIEFVAQGRGKLTLDGKAYELGSGTVFSYGRGVAQDIVSDPDEPLVKYFVDFTGKSARALLQRHQPKPGQVMQTSAPGEVLAIFDDLIRNGLRDSPFSPRIAAVLLEHLVLKLAETAIPFGLSGTAAFATYRRCRQWIEDHHMEVQTLAQIATRCHIDQAYLCRLFQRFDHQTPYQYLSRQKMSNASERLQRPGSSVKQVADELGFSDAFHFSRVYKRIVGIPPAEFVRLCLRS